MKKLIAVAALFLLASPATPQQSMVPTMGETIEVSIVNVDVVVTDKQGNRIRGLTKEDFEIFENGRKQPISNFAAYSAGAADAKVSVATPAAPVQAEAPAPPPEEARTIVVFVEQFYLPAHRTEPFISALKQLLANVVRPGDAVSIVSYDEKVSIDLGYTDHLAEANEVLDKIGKRSTGAHADLRARVEDEVGDIRRHEAEAASMAAARGLAIGATQTQEKSGEGAVHLRALRELAAMKRRVGAINAVIHTMAGATGKKVLVLAANHLSEFAGADYAFVSGSDLLPAAFRQQFDCKPLIQTMVDNANASGVTIYPIYPTAMPASDVMPDVSRPHSNASLNDAGVSAGYSSRLMGLGRALANETIMLDDVAKKTGGLAAWDTTAIVKLLPSIADDVHEYYSLAYRIESKREDRARNVVVKTKNKDYVVRSRQQYVERSDDTQMKDRVVAMLFHDIEPPHFGLSAEVGERYAQRSKQMLPLSIRIPIKDLTVLPQGDRHVGEFAVFVASRGERGGVSEVTRRSQHFEIPETDLERAKGSYFTYEFELMVDGNTDKVAIGVYDEVGRAYSLLAKDLPKP